MEKVTETFSYADISLYKLNNKHMNNLIREISHSLPSEITCRKTVLQLSADELLRIKKLHVTSKIFWLLMRALYLAYNI